MFALISSRSGSQSAMMLRRALQGHHGPLVLNFIPQTGFDILYKFSQKCQIPFSRKNKKNIISLASVEFANSMVRPKKKK